MSVDEKCKNFSATKGKRAKGMANSHSIIGSKAFLDSQLLVSLTPNIRYLGYRKWLKIITGNFGFTFILFQCNQRGETNVSVTL